MLCGNGKRGNPTTTGLVSNNLLKAFHTYRKFTPFRPVNYLELGPGLSVERCRFAFHRNLKYEGLGSSFRRIVQYSHAHLHWSIF